MTPRIKICCIGSIDEARTAIDYGASALGLVGEMPSGPGVIDDDLIGKIARMAPPPIATFLLTSRTEADGIIDHVRQTAVNTVQIVDAVDIAVYGAIRHALPSLKIVQVVHVIDTDSVEEACSIAPHVDALLLDSGNPNAAVKELGGTGRVHDWSLSRRIVADVACPVFLAGGLNPDNVADAVRAVRPFGIDVCSGVRTNGQLDGTKTRALIRSARRPETVPSA